MLVTKLADVRLDSKYLIWSVALQLSKLHIQCMKKSLRIQFGERVKELRIATGLSQEAFADRCGFARSYMSRIERGGSNASLDAIEVLANALSVEPWQLLASDSSKDDDPELLVHTRPMARALILDLRVVAMVCLA